MVKIDYAADTSRNDERFRGLGWAVFFVPVLAEFTGLRSHRRDWFWVDSGNLAKSSNMDGFSVPGKESCILGQWCPKRNEDEGITRLLVRVGKDSLDGIDEPLFGHGADEAVHFMSILEEQECGQALDAVSDRR